MFAQSDQDIYCPLIESLGTAEHKGVEQNSWSDNLFPLADLDPYCLHLIRRHILLSRGSIYNSHPINASHARYHFEIFF